MLKNLLMNLLRSRRDPQALATAHAARAAVLRNANDLAGAERSCRSALALQDDANHRLLLVDILEAANRRDEAIAELLLAQECAPGRFDILLRLFGALCDVGFFTEALRLAERAVGERGRKLRRPAHVGCSALRHG